MILERRLRELAFEQLDGICDDLEANAQLGLGNVLQHALDPIVLEPSKECHELVMACGHSLDLLKYELNGIVVDCSVIV
jgi:hypothetical protein